MSLEAAAQNLPARPGVYLFKSASGRVLYAGKATNLRSRVRSYFVERPDRAMIPDLVEKSTDLDFIITNTPDEALVLERQLIREHKPRFNSMLKDDKSFPYLAFTADEIPRVLYTRHPPKGARVWGPFPRAGSAKSVLHLMRRQFGIRDCKELLPQGCLSMHIGMCSAPCIDSEGYEERIEQAARLLDGDASAIIAEQTKLMENSSANQQYELAAISRDRIRAIRNTIAQQVISSTVYRQCDAIGFAAKGDLGLIVVLHADDGIIRNQESWQLIHRGDIGETINRFIADHYQNRNPPKLLVTPVPISEPVSDWLERRRGSKVDCRVPRRGDLKTLRILADQNATVQIEKESLKKSGSIEQRTADEGAEVLGMDSLDHIVCFDMAQLQGDERVGASVVFRNGRPEKSEYRKYTIRGKVIDDLRMMREVVERWLKKTEEWPDLLLIDGGQTHLNMIHELLVLHGLEKRFPLAALAKREETIHRINHENIILDRRGRVLIHCRDEAHRFVNRFHRKRRFKSRLQDPLEEIPGLGAKKLQALLRDFGGRKGIEHASVEDLILTKGIGRSLAQRIHDKLHR